MGCSATKQVTLNIEEEYKSKGLPMPDTSEYENAFEKEAFMTINLFRHDPKHFLPQIREAKGKYKELTDALLYLLYLKLINLE
jgi:hypothetical protein